MKTRFLMLASLLVAALPALGENTPTRYPLESIVQDMGGASLSQVRQTALNQAEYQPKYKSVCVESNIVFEGDFTNTVAKALAVFSDDGVDVTVDGPVVHYRYGQGQHLPNLGASFHVLPVILPPVDDATPAHHITVRYSNIIYRGLQDIDGCTLFAFDNPVQLDLNNMSMTVADGTTGLVHVMSSSEKLTEGAELRINANFDEGNTLNGYPLEDYLGNDHIQPSDPDLLGGTVYLCGAVTDDTFTVELEKSNPQEPNAVTLWIQKATGQWSLLQWGANYAVNDFPISGGIVTCPVRVEGVEGSRQNKDHRVKVNFRPKNAVQPFTDKAALTVVKTEFMLTFDDGPYRADNKTKKILDTLQQTWINGHTVTTALMQVGIDHSKDMWFDPGNPEGIDGFEGVTNYPLTLRGSNERHQIGNHTAHHAATTTTEEISLCATQICIALNVNQPPHLLFRPPYLHDIDINHLDGAVLPAGYKVVWGFLGGDAYMNPSPPVPRPSWQKIRNNIVQHLETWRTKAIPQRRKLPLLVILHDWPQSTYENLQAIIDGVRRNGFVLTDFALDKCYGTDKLSKPTLPSGNAYYDDTTWDDCE